MKDLYIFRRKKMSNRKKVAATEKEAAGKKSDRNERIEELVWLQKVAKDGRLRAEDRRMARERITKIAEEYNITYKDVFERMDKERMEGKK